jgi:heptose I phosphotransferase
MSTDECFLDEPFRTLWEGQDPFVAVEALEGQVFRELEGRRTLRSEVAGRTISSRSIAASVGQEIFKNLLSLRLPVLGARERVAGDPAACRNSASTACAPSPSAGAAAIRRGNSSFIVTEELAPTVSLEDYCLDWVNIPPPFA